MASSQQLPNADLFVLNVLIELQLRRVIMSIYQIPTFCGLPFELQAHAGYERADKRTKDKECSLSVDWKDRAITYKNYLERLLVAK